MLRQSDVMPTAIWAEEVLAAKFLDVLRNWVVDPTVQAAHMFPYGRHGFPDERTGII